MDALPETKGKGVLMFVQRRKRIDEFILEQEVLSSKQPPMGAAIERQRTEERNVNDTMKVYAKETKYIGVNPKKPLEHHQDAQQTNNLSNMPKPLVPNRTARPFLGFQGGFTVAEETLQAPMEEVKFKRPSLPNSNPKVWSPTADIIASRDERIYVPAIKTGILSDSKRKSANKQPPASAQASERQNKGERRSYIEPEEDCFSLGAEACNFMQPRTIKLKNPPPVAPKPPINPACPPWMTKSPSSELHVPSRSPISQLSRSPVGGHSQNDGVQPQQMTSSWPSDQTQAALQTPANAWVSVSSSPKLHPQPSTNSWSHQPSSGFGRSRSLSLSQQLNSAPVSSLLSPGDRPSFFPTRQTSFQEKLPKPPTPWEAASKSPTGTVDDAFNGLPSYIASKVNCAAHRMSLSEPPEEWKRRVSLDCAAVSRCHHSAPAFQPLSMSCSFSSEKPAIYGPPFRPAQPLRLFSWAGSEYRRKGSSPTK